MNKTEAADVTDRSVHLSSSTASATTSHEFEFTIATPGLIGSLAFEYCSNSPLDNVVCAPPSGFDISGAVLSTQTGETGFAVHANTTANRLVLTRPPAAAAAIPVQYLLDSVVNPDTPGTHYVRIYTYATDDATGLPTDRGGIAISLNSGVDVSTFVPPILEFCVAVAITSTNCTTTVGSNINFGTFESETTSFATTQMVAATNGVGGYSISVIGTTMTSGNNVIPALAAPSGSNAGTSQFGINLRNNANPNVGVNVTGLGSGAADASYNSPNNFMFADSDIVARSLLSTDYNKYTVSYIVNINPDQAPGFYATTISYVALASF
jgi:hypothetical protein